MSQKFEVIREGDRTKLVVLFHATQEFYLDADVYLKRSDRWLQYRGLPCSSLDEAREFFDTVAESWGEVPGSTWVFILGFSSEPVESNIFSF